MYNHLPSSAGKELSFPWEKAVKSAQPSSVGGSFSLAWSHGLTWSYTGATTTV